MESRVRGVDRMIRKLNKATKDIEKVTMAGLIRGAIIVRRDMDKTSPLIPVDQGNLRASWFVSTSTGKSAPKSSGQGDFKGENADELSRRHSSVQSAYDTALAAYNNPMLIMGFTANYAIYVHEMVGAEFKRPGAGAKFFQASLRRNQRKILEVIAEESRKAL